MARNKAVKKAVKKAPIKSEPSNVVPDKVEQPKPVQNTPIQESDRQQIEKRNAEVAETHEKMKVNAELEEAKNKADFFKAFGKEKELNKDDQDFSMEAKDLKEKMSEEEFKELTHNEPLYENEEETIQESIDNFEEKDPEEDEGKIKDESNDDENFSEEDDDGYNPDEHILKLAEVAGLSDSDIEELDEKSAKLLEKSFSKLLMNEGSEYLKNPDKFDDSESSNNSEDVFSEEGLASLREDAGDDVADAVVQLINQNKEINEQLNSVVKKAQKLEADDVDSIFDSWSENDPAMKKVFGKGDYDSLRRSQKNNRDDVWHAAKSLKAGYGRKGISISMKDAIKHASNLICGEDLRELREEKRVLKVKEVQEKRSKKTLNNPHYKKVKQDNRTDEQKLEDQFMKDYKKYKLKHKG